MKATTLNALRSTLRFFFAFTSDAGYAEENAARRARRARCGSSRPRGLGADDQRRLLDSLARAEGEGARRDHALFHTMLATGIRVGSAVALDVEDVDLDGGVLNLRPAKGDRSEVAYLGREIGEHMRTYLSDQTTGPAFPARDGRRLTTRHVHRRLAHWLSLAGSDRPISPHGLRHTFATQLYRRTGDVHLVKQALGHRSIASAMGDLTPAEFAASCALSCSATLHHHKPVMTRVFGGTPDVHVQVDNRPQNGVTRMELGCKWASNSQRDVDPQLGWLHHSYENTA